MKYFIIVLISCGFLQAESVQDAFTNIYEKKIWGVNAKGEGCSGGGSTLEATSQYRAFLQQFLQEHAIRSVVDAGCGDWEFSQTLNWEGIDYQGFDVVKSVILRNRRRFAAPNIHFRVGNATALDLPQADLLLCKDVLQHLPNQAVKHFIEQLHKFKYCLITNDVDPSTQSSKNEDIRPGEWRNLDLRQPPFSLQGRVVLQYQSGHSLKQVLLIKNNVE